MSAIPASQNDLQRAQSLLETGRIDESEEAFTQLLTGEHRGAALYGLAMVALRRGQSDRALALFEQSLGVNRKNANALYYIGRIQSSLGRQHIAVAAFGEALSQNPTHQGAIDELAKLLTGNATAEAAHDEPHAGDRTGEDGEGSPYSPRADSTPPRVKASLSSGATVGIVRNLMKGVGPWRGKPASLQIWTFRLELCDSDGNATGDVLGVEMRGHEITGSLDNGDWVEISERPTPGEGLRPKTLRNLTTSDVVKSKMRWLMAQ